MGVFTLMFTLVPLFIAVVFMIVIGSMLIALVRALNEWSSNNAQPVLTVAARVVTKRQHVSGGGHETSASTRYYVTFESVADGLRQEFAVPSADYSGLADGDTGDLTYQGTRYKGFVRQRLPLPVAPPPEPRTCGYCHGRVPIHALKCPACGAA
jgi:Protein of unknown function (DUF2500)